MSLKFMDSIYNSYQISAKYDHTNLQNLFKTEKVGFATLTYGKMRINPRIPFMDFKHQFMWP